MGRCWADQKGGREGEKGCLREYGVGKGLAIRKGSYGRGGRFGKGEGVVGRGWSDWDGGCEVCGEKLLRCS